MENDEQLAVYGILIYQSVLHYLVVPRSLFVPYWYPADLFEVIDSRLHWDSYFRYLGEIDPSVITVMVGYKELITDEKHYMDLIERDPKALQIFVDKKQEIDKGFD